MNLYAIPMEVRCPECGVAMVTGPAPSRLFIPNRWWAKCPSRHCANHGLRHLIKVPMIEVEKTEKTTDEMQEDYGA